MNGIVGSVTTRAQIGVEKIRNRTADSCVSLVTRTQSSLSSKVLNAVLGLLDESHITITFIY